MKTVYRHSMIQRDKYAKREAAGKSQVSGYYPSIGVTGFEHLELCPPVPVNDNSLNPSMLEQIVK